MLACPWLDTEPDSQHSSASEGSLSRFLPERLGVDDFSEFDNFSNEVSPMQSIVWGASIGSHKEPVDSLHSVQDHPVQDGRLFLDFHLYRPFKRYFHCSELLLEFSDCSLCHAIRLRVISNWILKDNVNLRNLFCSLGHRHEGWLSIGL